MMRCLIVLFLGVVAVRAFAEELRQAKLTQEDVDRIVETQILMFEHSDDADGAEQALLREGVTKEMLSHAYLSVMKKTNNSPERSLKSNVFGAAAWSFAQVAKKDDLKELLVFAESSSNELNVGSIVCAYYNRDPVSREFMEWCAKKCLQDDFSPHAKATIWHRFEMSLKRKDLADDVRETIMNACRKGLFVSIPHSVASADEILCENDSTYKKSPLRREALSRILAEDKGELSDYLRARLEKFLKEAEDQ